MHPPNSPVSSSTPRNDSVLSSSLSRALVAALSLAFLLLSSASYSQSVSRNITDPRMWNAIRYSLDERDKLLKRFDARTYDAAMFVIDLVEVPRREITAFRAFAATGKVLVEEFASEEDIRNLFGEELFVCIRDCPYQFEVIDTRRIGRSTSVPSGLASGPASVALLPPDGVVGLDELLLSPSGSEAGLHVAQGDFTLGLPQHLGGFSRIGARVGSTRLGLQAPFVLKTAATADRLADGAIGGYGESRLTFGALALEIGGFYQFNTDEAYVNYRDRTLVPVARAAGRFCVGWTMPLGGWGRTEILLGGQAMTMDYRRVAGESLVPRPSSGDTPNGTSSWIKAQAWLRFRSPVLRARSGFAYHRIEAEAGLAGNTMCASLTWSPWDFLGLRIQAVMTSSPEPWQQESVILATPVLRWNW